MGNQISQISVETGLVCAEQIERTRPDYLVTQGNPLPADHDDFTPRLASLSIPLPADFRMGARRGTEAHHALRDALNLLTETALSPADRLTTPSAIRARLEALSLVMRLGGLDGVILPEVIETNQCCAVMVANDAPDWLRHLLAEGEAFTREHAGHSPGPLNEQLSNLAIAGVDAPPRNTVVTPALTLAVLRGATQEVREHLSKGADVNAADDLGRTALHAAAITGSARMIRILTEAGGRLDVRDHKQRAPLDVAIQAHKPGAVEVLIAAGSPLNAPGYKGFTPLALAINLGFTESLNHLLKAGADPNVAGPGGAPLHHAIFTINPNHVKKLLEHGADPGLMSTWGPYISEKHAPGVDSQEISPLECAAITGQQRVFNLLLAHGADMGTELGDGTHLLSRAAIGGNLGIIDSLLKAGAPIDQADKDGRTPLFWAAAKGVPVTLTHLLKRGADPKHCDADGNSLLHIAAISCMVNDAASGRSMVDAVMRLDNIKINARNHRNQTALHIATGARQPWLVDLLIAKGANLEAKDDQGRTPLHTASGEGHPGTIAALLAHGANCHTKDAHGHTALHFSVEKNHLEATRLLLKHGADPGQFNHLQLLPVHIAAFRGNLELLALLSEGRPELLNTPGRGGVSALHIAKGGGHTECVAWMEAQVTQTASSRSHPNLNTTRLALNRSQRARR